MRYRHTVKRFKIDINADESKSDFLERIEIEAKQESDRMGKILYISTNSYISFIFDKDSPNKEILSAVIEINEIPTKVSLEFEQLLVYHDEVKQIYDGSIVDIDYEEAERYIQEQIINLKSILTHTEGLRKNDGENQI
jgi:hypothetical protein